MAETVIKVDGVSKDFRLPHEKHQSIKSMVVNAFQRRNRTVETQHALKRVSFEVKKGEFFGIVGRNGSGKSTLLKILAGIYQPTKGAVTTVGRLVPFIELGVGFNPELTGRENVYLNGALLGFSKKEIDAQYDDIVAFAELEQYMDKRLKNYSSGMQVRLAFSMAIRARADILLIDEVLAVGDADFQRKCFEYFKQLKRKKKTVVFVSHDMDAIKEFCDKAALIEKNELKSLGNPYDIAREYSVLFLEDNQEGATPEGKKGRRWGNGDITIEEVSVKPGKDDIFVNVTLKAAKHVDKMIYGLHIAGQDGVEITAMNNRMINAPDIKNIEPGATMTLQWKVLNVFNDGKYSITLTFINDVATALDWWVDAAQFTVKRIERSTTAVLPPVSVEHTIRK